MNSTTRAKLRRLEAAAQGREARVRFVTATILAGELDPAQMEHVIVEFSDAELDRLIVDLERLCTQDQITATDAGHA